MMMFDSWINISINRSVIAFTPPSIFARGLLLTCQSRRRNPGCQFLFESIQSEWFCAGCLKIMWQNLLKRPSIADKMYLKWHTCLHMSLFWFFPFDIAVYLFCSVVRWAAILDVIARISSGKSTDRYLISPWALGANHECFDTWTNISINRSVIARAPHSSFRLAGTGG